MAATYNTLASTGLFASSTMCVVAAGGMPVFDTRHVLPPSSLTQMPPSQALGDFLRHVFGSGRSCCPLVAAHMRPRMAGSKTIQYVVFRHFAGMPSLEGIQLSPPFSL